MLAAIDYGDICVFNNGEEAAVTEYRKNNRCAILITFNKTIIGYSNRAKKQWCYAYNGRFLRDINDPDGNDIVKIVRS